MTDITRLCAYCNEREGITYINHVISCRSCYRKYLAARAFITSSTPAEPKPDTTMRSWTSTFITPDGRRQSKYYGPTHVQTSEPVVRAHLSQNRPPEVRRDKPVKPEPKSSVHDMRSISQLFTTEVSQ